MSSHDAHEGFVDADLSLNARSAHARPSPMNPEAFTACKTP
jgi:hypothetical protein